jgi:hypothetical protein
LWARIAREIAGVGVAPSLRWIRVHAVRGEHLERGALGRRRQRVSVLAEMERAVDALRAPVVADRLRDHADVRLRERPAQRRAAMPARAEAHPLGGLIRSGTCA